MSDIRKFAVALTNRLHLRNAEDELMYADGPDGAPDAAKPMAVNLYGPGSKQYSRALAAQNNRFVDRLKKKGKADQSAEDKKRETAEFLAACTESMENVEYDTLEGQALYLAVYTDIEIGFIAEQVGVFLGVWGNFRKGSSKP